MLLTSKRKVIAKQTIQVGRDEQAILFLKQQNHSFAKHHSAQNMVIGNLQRDIQEFRKAIIEKDLEIIKLKKLLGSVISQMTSCTDSVKEELGQLVYPNSNTLKPTARKQSDSSFTLDLSDIVELNSGLNVQDEEDAVIPSTSLPFPSSPTSRMPALRDEIFFKKSTGSPLSKAKMSSTVISPIDEKTDDQLVPEESAKQDQVPYYAQQRIRNEQHGNDEQQNNEKQRQQSYSQKYVTQHQQIQPASHEPDNNGTVLKRSSRKSTQQPISYKLPSITSKLRQGDQHTFTLNQPLLIKKEDGSSSSSPSSSSKKSTSKRLGLRRKTSSEEKKKTKSTEE